MSATDIQLVEGDVVVCPDTGVRGDHPADGLAVERGIGDLRADVAVQADQIQPRLIQHAPHRRGGMPAGQREAELLIDHPGAHRGVPVDVDVGGYPHQHLLAAAHPTGQEGDLDRRVQHNPAHFDGGGVTQLVGGFRVAVHDDPRRVHATGKGGGQFAARAHVQTQPLVGDPACHRDSQQRLPRVDHVNPGQRRTIAPHAMANIGLVKNVSGGAKFIGDLGQRHTADTEPPHFVDTGCQRPDRPVYAGSGGPTQGRQHLQQVS